MLYQDPVFVEQMAEAISSSVARQHEGRFSEEELALLRTRIQRASALLAELECVPLVNSDEPDIVFAVE